MKNPKNRWDVYKYKYEIVQMLQCKIHMFQCFYGYQIRIYLNFIILLSSAHLRLINDSEYMNTKSFQKYVTTYLSISLN